MLFVYDKTKSMHARYYCNHNNVRRTTYSITYCLSYFFACDFSTNGTVISIYSDFIKLCV